MPALPKSLLQSLQRLPGFDSAAFQRAHEIGNVVSSVRINNKKWTQYNLQKQPADFLPIDKKNSWSSNGYYLTHRPAFIFDPLLHAGAYYVQDASSFFIEHILNKTTDISQPLRALDTCAAPGGKSTLLQSVLSSQSIIVANELIATRAGILSENITRWGSPNIIVTQNDPKHFRSLPEYFDIVLVDAPCSGSGMFRKDPDVIKEWSPQHVVLCSQRQQRILAGVMPALKQNGLLIYSTCSYSPEENEQIADWLINAFQLEPVYIPIQKNWNIVITESPQHHAPGYRFYPHLLQGEGLYIACFRKKNSQENISIKKRKPALISANDRDIIQSWFSDLTNFFALQHEHKILLWPAALLDHYEILKEKLYIKQAGITAGKLRNKLFIPDHALALSGHAADNIPTLSLSKEEALHYLRKEMIMQPEMKAGWALARYENFPLGWIKVLNNRINNYYPTNWRITKSLIEE